MVAVKTALSRVLRHVVLRRASVVAASILASTALFALAHCAFTCWLDPEVAVPPPLTRTVPPGNLDPAAPRGASILFLGDTAPTDAALPTIARRGYDYPFSQTRDILASSAEVVFNLEAPITESDEPFPLPKPYIYKISPEVLPSLVRARLGVAVLANNHTNDYQARGLKDTLDYLRLARISSIGAGASEAEARRGLVLETPGGRLGLLAYMEHQPAWAYYQRSYALDVRLFPIPGVARLSEPDLAADIGRLRRVGRADAVIVSVHWGSNYTKVKASQVYLGKRAIELGADAVIGHHPHWVQPVAVHRGKPILYSLGNYAFGTPGRKQMRFGMAASVRFAGRRIEAVELIPLSTQNRKVRYCPKVPSGKALEDFFAELLPASRKRGAHIRRVGDRGLLEL